MGMLGTDTTVVVTDTDTVWDTADTTVVLMDTDTTVVTGNFPTPKSHLSFRNENIFFAPMNTLIKSSIKIPYYFTIFNWIFYLKRCFKKCWDPCKNPILLPILHHHPFVL